jgi:hypothetical protein
MTWSDNTAAPTEVNWDKSTGNTWTNPNNGVPSTTADVANFNDGNGDDAWCLFDTVGGRTVGGLLLRAAGDYDGRLRIDASLTLSDVGGETGSFIWSDTGISVATSGGNTNGNSIFITTNGSLTIFGNADFNVDGGTVPLNNAGTITFTGATGRTWTARTTAPVPNWGAVVINKSTGVALTLTSAITCGSLTVNSGTLSVNTQTMTITGDLVIDGADALVTVGSGSLVVQGNVFLRNGGQLQIDEGALTVTGAVTIEDGTVSNIGATNGGSVTSGGLLTIGDGDANAALLSMGRGNVTATGGLTIDATDGSLTFGAAGTRTLTFNQAAATTVSITAVAGTSLPNVVLNAGNATTSVLQIVNASTALSFTGTQGTLDLTTDQLTLTGNLTVTANGRVSNAGGVTFEGTSAQTWSDSTAAPGQSYGPVTIDNATGVQLAGTSVTCSSLSLTSGSLDLNGRQLTLNGLLVTSPITGLGGGNQVIDSNAGATSTIRFTGTPAAGDVVVPDSTNVTYESLVFNGPAAGTGYALQGNTTATSLTVTQGTLKLSTFRLNCTSATVSTVAANGSVITGTGGELETVGNLDVPGGTINATGGTLDVDAQVTNTVGAGSPGTITMGGGAFELGDDADFTNITFTSTGNLLFNRVAGTQQDLTITANDTFGSITVNETSTNGCFIVNASGGPLTLTITALTITAGRLAIDASPATNLVVNGATTTAGSLTLGGTGDFNGTTAINGALILAGTVDFDGAFSMGAAGTLDQNAFAVTFSDDVDLSAIAAGDYTDPGDVTFDKPSGTAQVVLLPAVTLVFDDVTIARPLAADVVSFSGSGTLQARTIAVTTGILAANTSVSIPAGPVAVGLVIGGSGRLECTSGTARTFQFLAADATNSVTIASGGDFVFSGAAHTITFAESRTVDVNGNASTLFDIDGSAGTITLQDTNNNTTRWILEVDAAVSFSVLSASIIDSDGAGTAIPLVAAASTRNDTLDWIDGRIWLGGTNGSWSTGTNWTGGAFPSTTEAAVFDSRSDVATNQPLNGVGGLGASIGGLLVRSAYTKTITIDATLVLTGDFSWDAGVGGVLAFTTNDLEAGGNVTLNNLAAGDFTTSATSRLVIDQAGATTLSMSGAGTLAVGLAIGDTGTNTTISLPQDLTVTGACSIATGSSLALGGNLLTANGGITVAGTLDAAGGTATQTTLDTTALTVTGTFIDGNEDVLVSGNLSVTGTWTNDTDGRVIFDGQRLTGTAQQWSGGVNIGEVRVDSTANGFVRLTSAVSALSVVVAAGGDTLDTSTFQLTVSGTTTVSGGGFLLGGSATTAVRTGGLTIAGTYTEGSGDTRVSGALDLTGGTWTNDTAGDLIFDGNATTQSWTGSGAAATGVGEVVLAGTTPNTVNLQTNVTVIQLSSAGVNNNLGLDTRTLTVLGGGALNPPLSLGEANDLVAGTSTVLFVRTSGTDTQVANLPYNDLQLTAAAATATYRPATGAVLSVGGAFQVGVGAAYTTLDGGGTNRALSVTGASSLAGSFTAAGGVNLTFTGNVTVTGTTTLTSANATFGGNLTTTAGTLTHSAGTITFDAANNTRSLNVDVGDTFNAVTVQNNTDIQLTGRLVVTNALTITGGTSTTFFTQTAASAISAASLSVNGAGAVLNMAASTTGALTLSGGLTLSQGTVTLGTGGADVNGAVTINNTGATTLNLAGAVSLAGDVNLTNLDTFSQAGTVIFDGGGPVAAANTQTLTIANNTFGGNVAVQLTDNADAATPDTLQVAGTGTWSVTGTLTVTSGVVALGVASDVTGITTINIGGRLQNVTTGSLTHRFRDDVVIDDGAEFVFGHATNATTLTLTFAAGATAPVIVGTTAPATFSAIGGGGAGAITLQSSTGGSTWIINAFVDTGVTVTNANIVDSNASPGVDLTANTSYDATPATTTGWIFPAKTTSWTGGGLAQTNWTVAANWDPGIPNRGDTVNFDRLVVTNSTMNIDFGATGIGSLLLGGTLQFTGTLTLNQSLRVSGATQVNAGATLNTSNSTLTADGGLTVAGALQATGGTAGTAIDATSFTLSGTYAEGVRDTLVSGNFSITANGWTNAAGTLTFDGGAVLATPQTWSGNFSVGNVAIQSTTNGYVAVQTGGVSATAVTVASGDTLDTNGAQLTVSGTTTVSGGGFLIGGAATTAVRTGGLTIAGTYTEGSGDTRVSGALDLTGGTWTNNTAGDLIFDGNATTQNWTGSGAGLVGVGEVILNGTAPNTVSLQSDVTVLQLSSAAVNNNLGLGTRTLTVLGGGALNPPLTLGEANDLVAGTGVVLFVRPSGTDTQVASLAYNDLQLTAAAATATYRPATGAVLSVGGAFQVGAGAAYTTSDGGATNRDLSVTGASTLAGSFTAAGGVTLTFTGNVTVTGTTTLTSANATLSGNLTTTAGTLTHSAGTITFTGAGNRDLAVDAGDTVNALTIQGDADLRLTGALVVTNALTVTGGTSSTFVTQTAGSAVSAGSLVVNGAGASFSMATSTAGTLVVAGGVTISQGAVVLGTGGSDIGGSITFNNTGATTLTMAGTVNLAGSLDGTNADTFTAPATLILDGTTQTLTLTSIVRTFNAVTVSQVGIATLAVNGGGNTWATAALQITGGAVTLGATTTTTVASLLVNGGSLATGANTVTSAGLVNVAAGTLTVSASGVLIPQAALTVTGTFSNAGVLRFNAGSGTWTDNASTATFGAVEVLTGSNVATGSSLVCTTLTQTGGALTVGNTHTFAVTGAASLTSAGTLTVSATGVLECRGGLTATSGAALANGGTLRFTTNAQFVNSNLVLGAVVVSGCTVEAQSDLTVTSLAAQSAGQLNLTTFGAPPTRLTARGNVDLASAGGGSLVMTTSQTLRFDFTASTQTYTFNAGASLATALGNLETFVTGGTTGLVLQTTSGMLIGGTFNVAPDTEVEVLAGLFRVTGITTITGGGGTTPARLDLQGAAQFDQRVNITTDATLEIEASASFLGSTGGISVNVAGTFVNDVNPVTLTFLQGALLNVANNAVITVAPNSGSSDLFSSQFGSQFTVEIGTGVTQTFTNVRVRDSDGNAQDGTMGGSGTNATATTGTQLSNVIDWVGLTFAEFAWTGAVNNDWGNAGNYTGPGGVPFAGARLAFNSLGNGNPAPSTGTMPDLGEIDIASTYAPAAAVSTITFTGSQTIEQSFAANSANAGVNLGGTTLIVLGNVQVLSSQVFNGGLSLEGTSQTLDLSGTLFTGPIQIGNGTSTTTATLARALVASSTLQVRTNATLVTAGLQVNVAGASTLDGGLTATTSLFVAGGTFDADGAGAVTFSPAGTLRLTGTGASISADANDTFGNLQVQATTSQAGATPIDVDGALTVSGGTFTLSAGLEVAGTVNLIGGSLSPGASSVVTLDGAGTRTLTLDSNDAFYDLTISVAGGDVDVLNSGLVVNHDLTVTSGQLDLTGLPGNRPSTVSGALSVTSTCLTGAAALTVGAGTTVNAGGTLTAGGLVTITTGGLSVASTGTFSQGTLLDINGGSLTANGAVNLTASGVDLSPTGSVLGTTGTITVTGGPTITVGGDWTFAGTQSLATSTVVFSKAAAPPAQVGAATTRTFNVISMQGAAGVQLAGDVVAAQVTHTAGTLSLVDLTSTGRTLRLVGGAASPLQVPDGSFTGFVGANLGTVDFQTSAATVAVPSLGYGNLTISATSGGTYTLSAATGVEGALSMSGAATTVLVYNDDLTVTGAASVAANNELRAGAAGADLAALSISGGGLLALQNLTVTVTVRSAGTPLSITTLSGVAEASTITYTVACTVRGGFAYGRLMLSAVAGTYVLPANLEVRGDTTWSTTTSAAGTTLRLSGTSSSTFNCQSVLVLNRLEVAKAVGTTAFLDGAGGASRTITQLGVEQGNFDLRASTTFTGLSVIGSAAQPLLNAQFFVQSPGVVVTLGNITLHTNMLIGQGQLGVQIIFTVGTTLAMQTGSNLNFSGNANDKLEIRSSSGVIGQQAFITATGVFTVSATNVDVQNNNCTGVPAVPPAIDPGIVATNSNDSGATDGWSFIGGGNIFGIRATGLGDGQGRITKVQVLYNGSSPLKASTVAGAYVGYELQQLGASSQVVVTIAATSAALVNTASGQVLELTFGTGLGKTDTTNVRARYTPPATNRLTNEDGRPASLGFQLSVLDGAPPVLIGTSFQDVDSNGAIDRGVFFFSEEVGFSARRGVSASGTDPATSTATLGANNQLTLQIAGETLPSIDLTAIGLLSTGDLIASRIQTAVRGFMTAPPVGHDPLKRPAILNFTCEFVDGRYLLRAGVPLVASGAGYAQDFTASTVVAVQGGANDASVQLKLGQANGGVEIPGAGDAGHGILWSGTVDPDAMGVANTTLLLGLNGEDPVVSAPIANGSSTLEAVGRDLEAALRAGVEPQHSSNATAYDQFIAVPDRANNRLVLVSGTEGTGSAVAVDLTSALGGFFDPFNTSADSVPGRANTDTQLDDLNVVSASSGRSLILGRDASYVVCSGSTISVDFTNLPGDGTATPRYMWSDDGDLGFICDGAPQINRATTTFSNVGGALLLLTADTNGDRQLDDQAPGAGALDLRQGLPPFGTTGASLSLLWSFVEFIDPLTFLPDGSVTAATISLSGTTTSRPTFEARRAGTYRFKLDVQVLDANGAPVATPTTDSQGRLSMIVEYVVVDANPIAAAGPDQFVVGTSISLDASGSTDPNLTPPGSSTLSFQWTATDQNGTVIGGAFTPSDTDVAPSFTPGAPGVYVITLLAFKTADSSKFGTDSMTATITNSTDLLPTADAGDDVVRRVAQLVTLDGSRSRDPEGEALLYTWTFISGPSAVNLSADTSDRPSYTPSLAGAYVFELTVSDGVFSSSPDQVRIEVVDDLSGQPRRAPAAVARVAGVHHGVFLTGAPPTAWETRVTVAFADGREAPPVHVDLAATPADDPTTLQVAGTTVVEVYDQAGALLARVHVRVDSATAAEVVELLELGEEARVIDFGVAGETFVLDGTRSQDDGTIRSFTWTQVSGPTAFTSRTGSLVSVVPTAGTYAFDLVVVDATNLSSRAQRVTIPVVPASGDTGPPVARIELSSGGSVIAGAGAPWSPLFAVATTNGSLSLSGVESLAHNGAPLASFQWVQLAGPTAIFTNASTSDVNIDVKGAGTYRFSLAVTDSDGVTSTAEVWVTVAAPGQDPPIAGIEGPVNQVLVLPIGGFIDHSLRGSTSSSGVDPITLEWSQTQGVPVMIETDLMGDGRVRIDQPGRYEFVVRVRDANGVVSAPVTVNLWVVGEGDGVLASGATTSKSSGGCALTAVTAATPSPGRSWLLLGLLVLGLALFRRRAA